MIDLHRFTRVPGYNPDLELLCTIPPRPDGAAFGDLAAEFGIDAEHLPAKLTAIEREHGVHLLWFYRGSVLCVGVDRRHLEKVRGICQRYWRAVHTREVAAA